MDLDPLVMQYIISRSAAAQETREIRDALRDVPVNFVFINTSIRKSCRVRTVSIEDTIITARMEYPQLRQNMPFFDVLDDDYRDIVESRLQLPYVHLSIDAKVLGENGHDTLRKKFGSELGVLRHRKFNAIKLQLPKRETYNAAVLYQREKKYHVVTFHVEK